MIWKRVTLNDIRGVLLRTDLLTLWYSHRVGLGTTCSGTVAPLVLKPPFLRTSFWSRLSRLLDTFPCLEDSLGADGLLSYLMFVWMLSILSHEFISWSQLWWVTGRYPKRWFPCISLSGSCKYIDSETMILRDD